MEGSVIDELSRVTAGKAFRQLSGLCALFLCVCVCVCVTQRPCCFRFIKSIHCFVNKRGKNILKMSEKL